MLLSYEVVKLNSLAKEILLALSYLSLSGNKITFYSITKRVNEVREMNENFKEVSHKTVKKYLVQNLNIQGVKNEY